MRLRVGWRDVRRENIAFLLEYLSGFPSFDTSITVWIKMADSDYVMLNRQLYGAPGVDILYHYSIISPSNSL